MIATDMSAHGGSFSLGKGKPATYIEYMAGFLTRMG